MHAFQQQILSLPGLPIPPRRHRMSLSRTRFAKHSLLAVAYGLSPPKHSLKPRLGLAMMVRAALPDTICSRRSVIRLAGTPVRRLCLQPFLRGVLSFLHPAPVSGRCLTGLASHPSVLLFASGALEAVSAPVTKMWQLMVRHRPLTKCV